MSTLKVALVGSGHIAEVKHLPALKNLSKRATTVAICDLNQEQARRLAAEYGVKGVYADLAQMLSTERPDVVDICTPPKTHAPIAKACLVAGAHVLIEKPMCQTVEECDEVVAAASAAGRKICVAHSDLFYPAFVRARRMLDAGEIGEFRGMRIHLSTPVDYITSKPEHWAHKLPGGVFGESGPHIVYMTLAFINPIVDIQVIGRKLLPEYPWSPYEDYRVTLVGERAASTVTMIYSTKHWAAQVELWGADGTLRADLETQSLVHIRREVLKVVPIGLSSLGEAAQIVLGGLSTGFDKLAGRYTQTHQGLMQAFFEAIEGNTESPVPPSEGRESIRVMNLITRQL